MSQRLFRRDALQAVSSSLHGRAVIATPLSLSVIAAIAVLLGICLVLLLHFGRYAQRVTVQGIIEPDKGLIKVYGTPQSLILESHVREGAVVSKNDPLFTTGFDSQNAAGSSAQLLAIQELKRRKASLQDELVRLEAQQRNREADQRRKILDARAQIEQFDRELRLQTDRQQSLSTHVAKLRELANQQFLSPAALQQKSDELLEQAAKVVALERGRIGAVSDLRSLEAEVADAPNRHERERASLVRTLSAIEQDLALTEVRRREVLVAPHAGISSGLIAKVGQRVGAQPLVTIVPIDSRLEAHLYARSRAVGLIREGQAVRLRYAAFPFQTFGVHGGTIQSVSKTAVPRSEIPPELLKLDEATQEPVYRITVRLEREFVHTRDKRYPLVAGMVLEADILQEQRRLLDWMLDPLGVLKASVS